MAQRVHYEAHAATWCGTTIVGGVPIVNGNSADPLSAYGLQARDLRPELAERFGMAHRKAGVVITEVEPGSPAASAGLREGDLMLEADHIAVKNAVACLASSCAPRR